MVNYISNDKQMAASRVARNIYERAARLAAFPYLGRVGKIRGTRELPLTPLPFLIVYRVMEQVDAVEIVGIIHGAQQWPPVG